MRAKTRRDLHLRALVRLAAQARLNVGDAQRHRRVLEAEAWQDVEAVLFNLILQVRAGGLHVPDQLALEWRSQDPVVGEPHA